MHILKEIFLAGSLLKSDIIQILKRKQKSLALDKMDEDFDKIVDQVCGQLTLDHFLVGVSDDQNKQNSQSAMVG